MPETTNPDINSRIPETPLNPDQFPGRMGRFLYFTKHIKPLVDPNRVLVYTASGYDLSVMMGSGAKEAIYVDPSYKRNIQDEFSSQEDKNLGFDVLTNRVRKVDSNPKIIRYTDNAAIMGTICFMADGTEKVLQVIGEDAVIFNRGYSGKVGLYVSLGHIVPELFGTPVPADVYAVSTIFPRAWGYEDITLEAGSEGEGFPVARSFVQQNLDKSQTRVLVDVGSNRLLEEIARRAKDNSADQIRKILALGFREQTIIRKPLKELAYLKFKKFWKDVSVLPPKTQEKLHTDLNIYLDNIFVGADPKLAEPLKQAIISASAS